MRLVHAPEMAKHLETKLVHYAKFFGAIVDKTIPTEVEWQLLSACGPARWTYWARDRIPKRGSRQSAREVR